METPALSSASFLQTAYARMLLTRIVDDCAEKLYEQGQISFVASSRGHEAVQVGSALCIEVGKDFTLPYYRDLGVVLTIGMTPYEVLRTYLQAHPRSAEGSAGKQSMLHWGYQKHNMITGPAPVATQILHAAGIAFACKLRKAAAVTVAYCGDGATTEPDFLEGITFAAQHGLSVVFICEQDCSDVSSLQNVPLPVGIEHRRITGSNVRVVYEAMQAAIGYAREGNGPVLIEILVNRSKSESMNVAEAMVVDSEDSDDPLLCCQQLLEKQGVWDEQWAIELRAHLEAEVEQAMRDALSDLGKEI